MYSFLAPASFLEVALKNVFVSLNDLEETMPQVYAPKQFYFVRKAYRHYLV